jgi:EAL domain-containing protein (putative c-di-GMP-specific phosphodiesterase class I)
MVTENNSSNITLHPSIWFFAGQIDESEPVRQVPIQTLPFRVGRRPGLQLTLPCNCVSKEHAEIFGRDGMLWVRDLNSTNGTYVNGKRVYGATKLNEGDIVQFATVVFRTSRQQADSVGHTVCEDACDRALSLMQFDRLLDGEAVIPFYQALVDIQDNNSVIGYEVLGRSRIVGLYTPGEMFATASQLNMEAELSRVMRRRGVEIAQRFPDAVQLFVNTHPRELADPGLLPSLRDLREMCPNQPMVLEIHEAAVTSSELIRNLRDELRELNMGLAFDDFGAGQARLVELGEARPDCLKFDMKLIQGIDAAPKERQEVVAMLIRMVNEIGVQSLAEGVETKEEHETLCQMGMKLGQGFFYGRPSSINDLIRQE